MYLKINLLIFIIYLLKIRFVIIVTISGKIDDTPIAVIFVISGYIVILFF